MFTLFDTMKPDNDRFERSKRNIDENIAKSSQCESRGNRN